MTGHPSVRFIRYSPTHVRAKIPVPRRSSERVVMAQGSGTERGGGLRTFVGFVVAVSPTVAKSIHPLLLFWWLLTQQSVRRPGARPDWENDTVAKRVEGG